MEQPVQLVITKTKSGQYKLAAMTKDKTQAVHLVESWEMMILAVQTYSTNLVCPNE